MTDMFNSHVPGLESPPSYVDTVIPDDDSDLAIVTRAVNVASSGTVRVTTIGGTTSTLFVAAGIPFPIRAERIWASGTTASGIVALY